MNIPLKKLEQNKKMFFFALAATFAWGFLAHGYAFANSLFSHDSLGEFNGLVYGNHFKIAVGRFVVPPYRGMFRTDLTLPWLIGFWSFLWIGLAVYLTIRIFSVNSRLLTFLIAGIFSTNIAVTATAASYLQDLDCDMLALLCAVAAVYVWKKQRFGFLLGLFFVTLTLGLYQSYISVSIVLAMFVCILDLLDGDGFAKVFIKGMKAIAMLLLGSVLYFICVKLVTWVTDVPLATGNVNTLDNLLKLTPKGLLINMFGAYHDCFRRLLYVVSPYSNRLIRRVTLLLGGIGIISVMVGLLEKQVRLKEKLLCICLVCLLPLGMNITFLLANGNVHDVMGYAIWLFYLLVLLLSDRLSRFLSIRSPEFLRKVRNPHWAPKWLCMILVFILIYSNIQTSNSLYIKKDLEDNAYMSLMTRVVYEIEQTEGYDPGTTPVVFVGISDQIKPVRGMEQYQSIIGAWGPGPVILPDILYYQAYFDYILMYPVTLVDYSSWYKWQEDPRAAQMPAYPADGSLEIIDGTLVVKLG